MIEVDLVALELNDRGYKFVSVKYKDVGLNKSDIQLKIGEEYVFVKTQGRYNYISSFRGKLILDCEDHITLKCNHGYCESFLKVDILMGVYKYDKPKNLQRY